MSEHRQLHLFVDRHAWTSSYGVSALVALLTLRSIAENQSGVSIFCACSSFISSLLRFMTVARLASASLPPASFYMAGCQVADIADKTSYKRQQLMFKCQATFLLQATAVTVVISSLATTRK